VAGGRDPGYPAFLAVTFAFGGDLGTVVRLQQAAWAVLMLALAATAQAATRNAGGLVPIIVPLVNPIRWRLIENRAMLLLDVRFVQTDLWDGDRSATVASNARGRDFGAEAANQCATACQSQETSIWVG
jgi:hypothetical protein